MKVVEPKHEALHAALMQLAHIYHNLAEDAMKGTDPCAVYVLVKHSDEVERKIRRLEMHGLV